MNVRTIDICWFCRSLPAQEEMAELVRLHKGGSDARWAGMETESIRVPRCEGCRSVHRKLERIRHSLAIRGVAGLVGGVVCTAMAWELGTPVIRNGLYMSFGLGYFGGVLLGAVGAVAASRWMRPDNLRALDSIRQYPYVAGLVAGGWKIVKGPNTFFRIFDGTPDTDPVESSGLSSAATAPTLDMARMRFPARMNMYVEVEGQGARFHPKAFLEEHGDGSLTVHEQDRKFHYPAGRYCKWFLDDIQL